MLDLSAFSNDDLSVCGDAIRAIAHDASSMEDAARRVVDHLHAELGDGAGGPAAVLVRLYKTHPFGKLPDDLREFARGVLGGDPDPGVRCLTLLASRGDLPEWNDRRLSNGHKAIPLESEEGLARLPMVAGLVAQFGLAPGQVVRPDPKEIFQLSQRTYDGFHVEQAVGSPLLPAQEGFVVPHRIRSAAGFGGILHSGDFYAVVLFSRVRIRADIADTLRILALAVRVALMRFPNRVFD